MCAARAAPVRLLWGHRLSFLALNGCASHCLCGCGASGGILCALLLFLSYGRVAFACHHVEMYFVLAVLPFVDAPGQGMLIGLHVPGPVP